MEQKPTPPEENTTESDAAERELFSRLFGMAHDVKSALPKVQPDNSFVDNLRTQLDANVEQTRKVVARRKTVQKTTTLATILAGAVAFVIGLVVIISGIVGRLLRIGQLRAGRKK